MGDLNFVLYFEILNKDRDYLIFLFKFVNILVKWNILNNKKIKVYGNGLWVCGYLVISM